MIARLFLRAALACALALAGAQDVRAHAMLLRASPAVGGNLEIAPAAVTLKFSERIEPVFSRVRVLDQFGKRVDKGDKHGNPSDLTELVVSLNALQPGTYKVVWRVVSVDTHVTSGSFPFHVGK
jgi:methionine-rich copper-binding protein CopC